MTATATRSFASLTRKQQIFVDALIAAGITGTTIHRDELLKVSKAQGMAYPPAWIAQDPERRAFRGAYSVPEVADRYSSKGNAAPTPVKGTPSDAVSHATTLLSATGGERSNMVPNVDKDYVPFGHYDDLSSIIKAALPKTNVWVTGLSGNGKTMMVEQVCAAMNRECIRIQITNLTDEDDLIGGFRLVNGETVWQDGPVVLALQRGAVLLLDEIDYGTSKLSCLQSVLEGNGVYMKQTNRKVPAAKGFMVIATANTKGQGDTTGKFGGTNCMNEAFLERFGVTLEQDYAPEGTECKIIVKKFESVGCKGEDQFAANLVKWAGCTRAANTAGDSDSLISTRRLVNVVELYGIFRNKEKAIKMAIARFDPETKEAFWAAYTKVDADARPAADPKAGVGAATTTPDPAATDPNAPPF